MKKIILPYDFSEGARNAVTLAQTLAAEFSADIELVYVIRGKRDLGHLTYEEEQAKVEGAFKTLLDEIRPTMPEGSTISSSVRKGKVYSEVVALADSIEDSVIVTSTHGASGFEEFFVGSNSLRIISASKCPVYTVHEGIATTPIKNIIFPLDTTLESRQKAPYVAKVAKEYGATVHIAACIESVNDAVKKKLSGYLKQVEDFFEEAEVPHKSTWIENEDLVNAVAVYAKAIPDAIVAITESTKDSLPIFLIGEKAQRLLCKSPVPVLVLPPSVNIIRGNFHTFGSGQ